MNREGWLTEAAKELEGRYFNVKGYKIPNRGWRRQGTPCASVDSRLRSEDA